jgi:hypothetical protein
MPAMSDATDLPPGWLFDKLDQLSEQMTSQHSRLREDMHVGFDKLREEMRVQNGRVTETVHRVTVLETRSEDDRAAASRRGTWAGIVAAAGLTGLLEGIRALWRH